MGMSRSGFYDYLKRGKSNRAIENEALTEMIEDIFHEHQGRYGARRIQKVLEQQNVHVNPKRVSKLMSEHGLIAKGTRRFYRYQANKTAYDEKENILNQVFKTSAKNQIWVGDITYIPTKRGWLYLAVFIDIFSRKVTGWAGYQNPRYPCPVGPQSSHWTGTPARGTDHSYRPWLPIYGPAFSGYVYSIWLSLKYEPKGQSI